MVAVCMVSVTSVVKTVCKTVRAIGFERMNDENAPNSGGLDR